MGFLENVYNKSPVFFQHLMTTVAGYQRNLKRYGKTYYQYRQFLEKFDKWSLEKKMRYQKEELVKFVNHVNTHSPFYKNLYKDIDISRIQNVESLKKLPIIDKEMLRENISDVFTINPKEGVKSHTGGTTGKSLVVINRVEDTMKRMAMLDHFKARVGFEHRVMKRASFNGKHIIPPRQQKKIFWRYNKACKQMIYSSFHITEENMKYYVESLNKFKPDSIDGFFTSMCDIASYIERHNISLEFTPIAIFPTSETLTKSGRELLERVFNCKVYNQYASSEGAPFVTECSYQNLHIELASGVFEHYQESDDEVLVTSFTTYGTPLVRYKIGDSMSFELTKTKCGCGMESTLVKEIEGRKLDFLYTSEGAKINGGNVANLFKVIPNAIIRAQTIQNTMNEVKILLEVDQKKYKREYDNILKKEFISKFGNETKIVIEHVKEIPREKSGKFRMIKNNISI